MCVASEWSDTETVREFKHLEITFTSDGRQDEELETRIDKASAVKRALHNSVVMKRELPKKAKLSIFKTAFVPILTYGNESWVTTERVRSQVQPSKMKFLRRIEEGTLFNKMRRSEIQKSRNIKPLLLRIEKISASMVWPCKQNASGKTPQTSFTC